MSTKPRELRAPGKAMILGEYVVLDGAPALVAAMDRYAHARLEYTDGDRAIEITTSLSEVAWRLRDAAGTLHAAPSSHFSLVEAVIQTLEEHAIALPAGGLRLHLDSSSLGADQKLGLGSSAAVAAIATLALSGEAGRSLPTDAAIHAIADTAHRRFQGGAGSGADVAAACLGGMLRIESGQPPRRLDAPPPKMLVVFTGYEADTREFVREVRARAEQEGVREALAQMRDAAIRGADAYEASDFTSFFNAVSEFHRGEVALTRASGVPVVTAEIARAVEIFEACGGVGKASGAGGGDIVLGFFSTQEALDAARARVISAGLEPIKLGLEWRGVLETSGF